MTEFRTQLENAVSARHSRMNPFTERWVNGELTRQQLGAWACQHYQYVSQFPRWCAAVYAECPDSDARDFLLENIVEEESGTKHVDLLIRFGEACGVSRKEIESARQLPTTRALTAWCFETSRQPFHIAAAGLLVGLESQVPGIYKRNLPPLTSKYGFDDLVAALAVHLVRLDVDGEELDLVIVEAVLAGERRQIALVDPGHLRFQPDEQPGGRDVEGLSRRLEAPCRQRPRRRQLARAFDLLAAHPAGLAESDQQVDVLRTRFFFDDVLEQEITRVRVGALGVDGRAPARELRNVLVMLAHPRAELRARQLAVHPPLGERIHAAVAGGHGVLELGAEFGHGSPPGGRMMRRGSERVKHGVPRGSSPRRREP